MERFWRGKAPLLLASKSPSRRALLAAAGIPFEVVDAQVDERTLEAPLRAQGVAAPKIAAHLACAKALAVSVKGDDRLVLGSDQTMSLDAEIFVKPRNLEEAKAQLAHLSGRSHELHSALSVARGGTVLFEAIAHAKLKCRPLSADFIARYIEAVGPPALASVGAYQIEGLGIHLFEQIQGDHTTILGLPLMPLLEFLRQEGSLVG